MSDAAEPLTEQNERPASSPDHQPETGRESETGRAGAHVWLMALAGSCEDAIIGRDAGGEITLWNEAAEVMFGYPAADIVGQPGTCLIPPDRIDDEAEIFGRVRRGEKIRRPQTTRQRRDGTIVAVSLIISPVRDDHGTIVGSCEVATGIGRRDEHGNKLLAENGRLRRLAQELAASRAAADRANQAKSGFLAGMSHELRTPLNSILGYARLLRLEGGLNATQTARVDALLKAGEHLLHVIAGALDLARIEAGQMERQSVPVDVQAGRNGVPRSAPSGGRCERAEPGLCDGARNAGRIDRRPGSTAAGAGQSSGQRGEVYRQGDGRAALGAHAGRLSRANGSRGHRARHTSGSASSPVP